jgi:hypothetical protein
MAEKKPVNKKFRLIYSTIVYPKRQDSANGSWNLTKKQSRFASGGDKIRRILNGMLWFPRAPQAHAKTTTLVLQNVQAKNDP